MGGFGVKHCFTINLVREIYILMPHTRQKHEIFR